MDNLHHILLSSAIGLESPKSLASDRAFLGFVFINRLSGFTCFVYKCMTFALRFNTSFLFDFKTYCL